MRLRIDVENVETGEVEEVLAGLVVARAWEEKTGESVAKKLETNTPTVVVELAHLAWNRKHGKNLTIDEFVERWEPVELHQGPKEKTEVPPSPPATDPS